MKKSFSKTSLRASAAVLAVTATLAVAGVSVSLVSHAQGQLSILPQKSDASPDSGNKYERGEYVARLGDCMACHSVDKNKPFAGGLGMASPFGTIYSTNITPDTETGIGNYTYDDFARVLREGKAKDGSHLYPAMPYPSYAKINDDDMHALYDYMHNGVNAVRTDNPKTSLPFPFNIRTLMWGWNLLYTTKGAYQTDSAKSASWNRGAYLVQGLGHCGACHTARGLFGQEKGLDQSSDDYLAGGVVDNWFAPSLRHVGPHGLGRFTPEQIAAFLKTGRSADGAAFGSMAQAVEDSTQYMSQNDLNAIAEYLSSLPGKALPPANDKSRTAEATTAELRSGSLKTAGAEVYLNNCSACHRSDGKGAMAAFPALGGNGIVNAPDPTSLIHIVLKGSSMPSTASDQSPLTMPDFGWRLNDHQVADVVTFIRTGWGNTASDVTPDQVANIRKEVMPKAGEKK